MLNTSTAPSPKTLARRTTAILIVLLVGSPVTIAVGTTLYHESFFSGPGDWQNVAWRPDYADVTGVAKLDLDDAVYVPDSGLVSFHFTFNGDLSHGDRVRVRGSFYTDTYGTVERDIIDIGRSGDEWYLNDYTDLGCGWGYLESRSSGPYTPAVLEVFLLRAHGEQQCFVRATEYNLGLPFRICETEVDTHSISREIDWNTIAVLNSGALMTMDDVKIQVDSLATSVPAVQPGCRPDLW